MHAVTSAGRLIAGRYRLQDPIGRGAMGVVWRGRDELLARDVAVKEVQITAQTTPADAEAVYERTLREARTAARLKHPSVVTVYDVVEENGSPWIVMELIEARALDLLVAQDGPLSPLAAAELGTGLAGALAAAHDAGVLHRDVKPGNVLVTGDGRAVLTDFGIATFAGDPSVTQTGQVVGTPGYTSPERLRGATASPASDLWSLGATLFAAVEGRGPFDRSGGALAITAGVATEDAPRAPSAGPLAPVIEALLSKDPADRPDAATTARLLAQATTAARSSTTAARTNAASTDPASTDPASTDPASTDPASTDPAAVATPPEADRSGTLTATPAGSLGSGNGPVYWQPVKPASRAPYDKALSDPALSDPALSGRALSDRALSGRALSDGALSGQALSGQALSDRALGARAAQSLGAGASRAGIGSGPGDQDGDGAPSAADGPGQPGSGLPARRSGDARTPSRRRLVITGAGIVTIVIAAAIGWALASRSPATQAAQNPSAALGTPPGGHPAGRGSAGRQSSSPPSGKPTSPAQQHAASASASGKPSPSGPGASGSPSPSPSASPSPTPTPTLPPGWAWHRFTAAAMGSAAGFRIGMPGGWTQSISGQVAQLNDAASGYHLTVSLAPWASATPLAEAQYLQKKDAASHAGYHKLMLHSIGFKALGGFRAAPSAEFEFGWQNKSGTSLTELVVPVTLSTASGSQPYLFTLWSASGSFGGADGVFGTALGTFHPVPAA